MTPIPTTATIPAPVPVTGLRTSLDSVLRIVLGRLDPSHATPEQVRDALHAAGVSVTVGWAADWIARCAELHAAGVTS